MAPFRLGEHVLDLDAASVTGPRGAEDLTPVEVRLLRYLASRVGEVVPRADLLVEVWGYRPQVVSRCIDKTLLRLREKLGEDGALLRSVYGQGLRLDRIQPAIADGEPDPSLFGRAGELTRIRQALGQHRLVTLTGVGGCGKTRLADEVIARRWRETAARIAVSAAHDRELLDADLLSALGVPHPAHPSALARALALRGEALVVLDECEGALPAVRDCVRAWLAVAPRVRVLATSRAALGLPGEAVLPLGPLDPASASALLRDRVRQLAPALALQLDDAEIDTIVASVDRLPLALILAASQAPILGREAPSALADRPLDVLRTSTSSMAQVLDRSFAELSPTLRRTLAACAVFEQGPARRDLVEVGAIDAATVDRSLSALADRSLIALDAAGDVHMLRLVRHWARGEIARDDPLWEGHTRWCAAFGDPDTIDRTFLDRTTTARLLAAAADLRAARRRVGSADPEIAGRCGLALLWPAGIVAPIEPGLALAAELASLPLSGRLRARISYRLGWLRGRTGDAAEAARVIEAAIPLCAPGPERVALRVLSSYHRQIAGDAPGAARELAAAEAELDAAGVWACRWWQQRANLEEDPVERDRCRSEALAAARRWGDVDCEVQTLMLVAMEDGLRSGALAEARRALAGLERRCLDACAPARHGSFLAYQQALLALEVGDPDAAEHHLNAALEHTLTVGASGNLARLHVMFGWVDLLRGELEQAAEIAQNVALDRTDENTRGYAALLRADIALWSWDQAAALRILAPTHAAVEGRGWTHLEVEVLERLALASFDPSLLDRADTLDATESGRLRRRALRLSIHSMRGERVDPGERDTLSGALETAGYLPNSAARRWLKRRSVHAERGAQ